MRFFITLHAKITFDSIQSHWITRYKRGICKWVTFCWVEREATPLAWECDPLQGMICGNGPVSIATTLAKVRPKFNLSLADKYRCFNCKIIAFIGILWWILHASYIELYYSSCVRHKCIYAQSIITNFDEDPSLFIESV